MDFSTRVDIDAEHFGDFLGDDDTLQLFAEFDAQLLGLEQFHATEAVSSSESQHVTAETLALEHQAQRNEHTEPVDVHNNNDVDEVISSASHISPRGTSPKSNFRKSFEMSLFGETIENMAARLESEIDSGRHSRGSSNRRTRKVLGPVKGNNRKGRNGELRCTECRKVHLKCAFSDEKKPCERCSLRRLECHKVYGKRREFAKILQVIESSSNEIHRSPSHPNYFEMTPAEQHGLQYVYKTWFNDVQLPRILSFLAFRSGIYINNASLRYALLALSASLQGHPQLSDRYRSQYRSAIEDIGRSNFSLDHFIAFRLIMSATPIESYSVEGTRYLREISTVIDDIRNGHVQLDFASLGIELDQFIHCFCQFARSIPVTAIDDQSFTTAMLESLEFTLPQLCNMYKGTEIQYGQEWVGIYMFACDLRYEIRSCFKQYLRSKLSGEQVIDTMTPLLRQVQARLHVLETFPLFLDVLEMDAFMLTKARPVGNVNGPFYQGPVYAGSGIDLPCRPYSSTHIINIRGELFPYGISTNAPIEEQKSYFKKFTGLRRRQLYLTHLQNLILLNLMETAVYGYSTRDGADLAIKSILIVFELHMALVANYPDYFALCISLAELQMRRLHRPDELKWVLAMKQSIPVYQKEKVANWEAIRDDVEVFRELLIRYEYWRSPDVKRPKF